MVKIYFVNKTFDKKKNLTKQKISKSANLNVSLTWSLGRVKHNCTRIVEGVELRLMSRLLQCINKYLYYSLKFLKLQ